MLPVVLYSIPIEWITHGKHSLCLFKNLFGTECYGCGMTRAFFSLLHFDLSGAFAYNRSVVLVAPILAFLYVKEVIHMIKRL